MNKDKYKPLKLFLGWVFAVGMVFVYAMLIQLIISFVLLSYVHMNIYTMLKVAIAASVVTGIVWPVWKHFKKK